MFSQGFTGAFVALLASAQLATAHMEIKNPAPFRSQHNPNAVKIDYTNTAPLAKEGTDYPCKGYHADFGTPAGKSVATYAPGQQYNFEVIGGAPHGGGSCQVSLSYDRGATFQVIQSIEGGCPLSSNYPFTIPSDAPEGEAIWAWTWINKIGNREFYMNCAPIKVGGGSGKASTKSASQALSSLPDMFVANLPATECSTAEGEDFNYPNPGKNLIEGNGAHLGDTLSGSGCTQMTKMGAGNGQIGSPTQPEAGSPAASQAPAQSSANASLPANGGGVFAPGASSAPVAVPTPTPITSKPVTSPQPAAPQTPDNGTTKPDNGTQAPSAGSGSGSGSGSSGSADCTPCNNDGAVVCIGKDQFGLCNHGCAIAQPLANGMSCSAGAIVASAKKRSLHFPRAHLHRRHAASHLI